MPNEKIIELEQQIAELTAELHELQKNEPGTEVSDYTFATSGGSVTLSGLFGTHDKLLVIHNMGQGCRYCTLWADGFNGLLPHLESAMSVVLVSPDAPELQRRFAQSRGWRFQLASVENSDYAAEQTVYEGEANAPGAVVYERHNGDILRKNACIFGPGDLYCSMWNLLALAGQSEENWVPQFRYWSPPEQLDDGGENVVD